MKKRTIYIGLFLIFIIGLISLIGTFAIDSVITEGNSSKADYLFNITLGDRTNREIVIPSYDSKIVDIKISNPNEFDMSYLLYLEGINSNISIINISDTDANGVLNSKSINLIKVFIQNNGSSDITVSIKDIVGFERETLDLPSNSTAINKGVYYKAIVKSNNKDYGKVKPNIKLSTKNGTVKYNIVPNDGYRYKSTTCEGTVIDNILTISNITSNISCEVVFEKNTVQVNLDMAGGVVETTYTTPQEYTYTIAYAGAYKIELWGAQGGGTNGGKGAYTAGNTNFDTNEVLKIYVGGSGNSSGAGGYNGGGNAGALAVKNDGGGGSTDVRYDGTTINSRIMVAGGGGGANANGSNKKGVGKTGGAAGGLSGYAGTSAIDKMYGSGGTQISGGAKGKTARYPGTDGSFYNGGVGGISKDTPTISGGGGGGGGYYGGGSGEACKGNCGGSGGGGSSYISGHTGCVAITSASSATPKTGCTTGTSDNSCSIHYSGKSFTNTVMIDGSGYSWTNAKKSLQQMPSLSGSYASGTGNSGNGAARITLTGNASYTVTYKDKYGTLPTPTKNGYTFGGWYTGENGTGTKVDENTVLTNINNHTLYAKWTMNTYTVTTRYYLYYQNKTWKSYDSRTDTIAYGNTFTPYNITIPTGYYASNTYYVYSDSNYSTQIGTGTVGKDSITVDNDKYVKVRYLPNSYTITYNLNGGIAGSSAPKSGYYADVVTVSNPTRSGYTFTGWTVSGTGASMSGTKLTIGTGNITLTANWNKTIIILYDYIKNKANTTTSIDFSQTSATSGTNGIYTSPSTDSGNLVYYYRGSVDNHLIFANFCWRIIRTTETSGVKLIYDGVPSSGKCNNTGSATTIGNSVFNTSDDNAKYVGYMYGSSISDTSNTTNSAVKTKIDTWYKNNMTSYTSKLEDTVFCNDRSYTTSNSHLYFGAYTRLDTNKQPTLKCQNVKDKFTVNTSNGNGKLTYPVGLITANEIAYAGAVYEELNKTFYLYNSGIYTWTLSPYYFEYSVATVFTNSPNGGMYGGNVTSSVGVRPVISLKSGTILSSGSGTASSPFVVE